MSHSPLKMSVHCDKRTLAEPFVIARETITDVALTHVALSDGVFTGRGEGTPKSVYGQSYEQDHQLLADIAGQLTADITHEDILQMLPAGSARNALDCALWDLRAKQQGKRVWDLVNIAAPTKPVSGAVTLSIDAPEQMAARALQWRDYPLIKIKLNNQYVEARIQAVRAAAPDTVLMVDVNEGWSVAELQAYAPILAAHNIALLEQPLPHTQDEALRSYDCPLPLAADESVHTSADLERLQGLYQWINIKLDKTGGLTEALLLAERASKAGFELMVGCMVGTSLAMAPGMVVGARCKVRDLDGASMLAEDCASPLLFKAGFLHPPPAGLWG